MARTSKKNLDELAKSISRAVGGEPFYIDWSYGHPSLYRRSGGGAQDISPRLPSGQLWEWMRAFLRGFEQCSYYGKKR